MLAVTAINRLHIRTHSSAIVWSMAAKPTSAQLVANDLLSSTNLADILGATM